MPASPSSQTRRRLPPEERRRRIVDVARTLFAERPYTSVSTADVAEAAGVTRSLVHHYFGGIREVFLAVAAESAAALSDVRTAGPETPVEERLARNAAAGLDVVEDNRETWLAIMGSGAHGGNPEIDELVELATEHSVERALAVNSDLIDDTPAARLALRCFNAFSREAVHEWVSGRATRDEVQRLLVATLHDLLVHTIPSVETQAQADPAVTA